MTKRLHKNIDKRCTHLGLMSGGTNRAATGRKVKVKNSIEGEE